MSKPLKFESVEQAERVLKPYTIRDRLRALVAEGFDPKSHGHKEVAEFIGASRERTNKESVVMFGARRRGGAR